MKSVTLYANENFPLPTVKQLRSLGFEVLTTHDSGHSQQALSDEAVLAFAIKQGYAVITLNRKHFIRLHQTCPHHCGIIVCSFDRDFLALAQRIDTNLKHFSDLHGQLIRINRPPR